MKIKYDAPQGVNPFRTVFVRDPRLMGLVSTLAHQTRLPTQHVGPRIEEIRRLTK